MPCNLALQLQRVRHRSLCIGLRTNTARTVYRKLKEDSSWGAGTVLPGSSTDFTDSTVSAGSAYEYQVIKRANLGYAGFGYIYAGIAAPMIENRGKVILIVAADASSLANELSRLQSDLTGDGWFVL